MVRRVNAFDALFLVCVGAMGLALFRVRPATLILAANQAVTLRAMSNISRFGKPASQMFLPDSIFSTANQDIAIRIFATSVALTVLFVVLPSRKKQFDPATLPKLPSWAFKMLVVYFVILIFSESTILSLRYTDPDRSHYGANLGGGTAFANAVFIYELARRTMTGEMSRRTAFQIIVGLFIGTDYLHGSTGAATGFVIVAALVILAPVSSIKRTTGLAAVLVGMSLLALTIRTLRSTYSIGEGGLSTVATSLRQTSSTQERTSQGIETMGNGTQYAAHVFECITLYEAGVSREWRSIYLPLVYTLEPSFLLKPLNIERPKEAAWELADYFIHGGGIFVVGELYWNGGYFCVFAVFAALAFVCWRADISYSSSFFGLMMTCHLGTLLQGTGYGFAQVTRGLINGLIAMTIWAIASRLSIGSSRPLGRSAQPSTNPATTS
jgi:hypothetical protein